MRQFKLAIILALLVVVGGVQADAKLILESPAAALKSERARLARLNTAYKEARRDVDEANRAYDRLKRGHSIDESKRAILKARYAISDAVEAANKLKAEIETQEKVVAEAEAALGATRPQFSP